MPAPEPGQIWADTDWRNAGRTIRIRAVDGNPLDGGVATVRVETEADASWTVRSTVGRQSRIRYTHTGMRGYRLVPQPDGAQ